MEDVEDYTEPSPAPTELVDTAEDLSGIRKAAILLVSLGVETAGNVLQHMKEEDVEEVSIEVARLENIAPDAVEAVLEEYNEMSMAQEYVTQGGKSFAEEALRMALGDSRAEQIIMRIEAATEVSGFHQLQTADTDQLSSFLQSEHPQTAALIFSHIHAQKAAEVLGELEEEDQGEILYRLASMEKTSPEFIDDVEEVLKEKMGAVLGSQLSEAGGVEVAAEILNASSRSTERFVLTDLRERDPRLADQIKSIMFTFDDLRFLEGRDLQTLLMEVEQKDLALALKAAPEKLEEKIYRNLSSRVAEMVAEEVELLGRVRVSDVDEAQNAVMETARELEAQEEIVLSRDDNAEFV